MHMKRILALGLFLTSLTSPSWGIVVNGGFESGVLSPWVLGGDDPDGPWQITTMARSGNFAAQVSANNFVRQDFAAVPTADISEFSFWLRNTDAQESAVDIFYSDGSLTGFIAYPSNTSWAYYDLTTLLAPGKSVTGIRIYGHIQAPRPATTFLDDVTMTVVPEPLSLGALAAGLAGLAMRRKR